MDDLLSGLGKFGLDNLKDVKLYEGQEDTPKEIKVEKKPEASKPVYNEEDFLFDKTQSCPICDNKFGERTVRTGKARPLASDQDLRPRFEQLDVSKYDVISCPRCGFTALSRYFGPMPPTQAKLIKENIAQAFVSRTDRPAVYTYEIAFERYQLCLVNAIVKRGKDSEKAYICLKTGWLLRGMAEDMDPDSPDYAKRLLEVRTKEDEYLKNAYDGFISARTTEGYPMCGMDESTLDFLLATLAIRFGQYDVAGKMVSGILTSNTANSRMKDKARDLKDIVLKEMKDKS